MALIVVEHMEEYPTRWLVAEYRAAWREAKREGGELVVTGVRDPLLQSILDKHGIPWRWEHSWELYDTPKTIVLDMWAEKDLQPWEASVAEAFVIGGIMGDHPPRRRGILLSGMFDWASKRRLSQKQMSIHVSAWAALMIRKGKRVNELRLCDQGEFEIETPFYKLTVTLPFAYPCDESGQPIIPESIKELLSKGVLWDEEILHF